MASAHVVELDERTLLLMIRRLGRTLDDLQKLRIQHMLRHKALERDLGTLLPLDQVLISLEQVEHEARLELVRLWRKHKLAPWAKPIKGIGELSISRLIAEIGVERVDKETGEINRAPLNSDTVSQLWAYCGYDPNRRRRKGMTQEEARACGSPRAKTQCYLIATAMLKSGNRELYDARREHTASREDWPLLRQHNDALRIVAKRFLRDLWVANKEIEPCSSG